jgi:23S rRNA (uracil1939-C5)-methyltransferase
VALSVLKPIMTSPKPLAYRNRAQFKTNGHQLGYLASGSHSLIDVTHCAVLNDASNLQLAKLRSQLPNTEWRGRRGQPWHSIDIDDQIRAPSINARLPFRQGNTEQNAAMREWLAQQIAQMDPSMEVLELFCGDGNFTTVLAQQFTQVHGVEGDSAAVAALMAQGWSGVSAETLNLFDSTAVETLARRQSHTQLLVLDPPRDGLKVRLPLLKHLRELETVVYISCDVASWARDCVEFMAHGFALTQVQPLDMFPQTPHIEVLSILHRP